MELDFWKDWNNFFTSFWEKQPCKIGSPTIFDEKDVAHVFEGIISATDSFCQGKEVPIRFFIEEFSVRGNLNKYFPSVDDINIDSYFNRIYSLVNQQSFLILINEFHFFSSNLFHKLRTFLFPIYESLGYPQDTLVALFAGNYTSTSFGVHVDNDHTFYILLKGYKQILLWPPDYRNNWVHNEAGGNLNYKEELSDAIAIACRQGDILYIPKGWWHVTNSEPQNSIALSIGIPLAGSSLFTETLQDFFIEQLRLTDQNFLSPKVNDDEELTHSITSLTLSKLLDLWNKKKNTRMSSMGFRKVPLRRKPIEFNAEVLFEGLPNLIFFSIDKKINCFCQGYEFSLPLDDTLIKLLEKIKGGGKWSANSLLCSLTEGSSEVNLTVTGIFSFLNKLYTLHAIDLS